MSVWGWLGWTNSWLMTRIGQHSYKTGWSQRQYSLDLAIGLHLGINRGCVLEYSDEAFRVLYKAPSAKHLIFKSFSYQSSFTDFVQKKENFIRSLSLMGGAWVPKYFLFYNHLELLYIDLLFYQFILVVAPFLPSIIFSASPFMFLLCPCFFFYKQIFLKK